MAVNFPLPRYSSWQWIVVAVATLALAIAVSVPNLLRSKLPAEKSRMFAEAASAAQQSEADTKIVQTGFMDLIVKNPTETSDRIRRLAETMEGFTVDANTNREGPDSFASLTIRVPANRFEETRAAVRRLGIKSRARDSKRKMLRRSTSMEPRGFATYMLRNCST